MTSHKKTFGIPVMHTIKMVCMGFLMSGFLGLNACSMIDEDLDKCNEQAKLDYELRLVTNMTTELNTKLTTQTDLRIAQELRDHLSDVFTDFAHDVDLSFYDTQGDSVRLHHDEHFMDANQASYTLNLPMRQYMHLASANILDNELVSIENDGFCHPSMLHQIERDTIDSHTTGIFTARQPMEVLEGVNQNFNVRLYMANCSATLVIDPRGYGSEGIQVYATGFATGFHICDSAYVFSEKSPMIRTTRLGPADGNEEVGFCCVTFPSRDPQADRETRTVIETEEPFIAEEGEEPLWEFRVYVPMPLREETRSGGTITESIIRIKEPQRAGEVKIIKVYRGENGEMVSDNPEVGISVTLDWKQGGTFTPVI